VFNCLYKYKLLKVNLHKLHHSLQNFSLILQETTNQQPMTSHRVLKSKIH